MVAAGQVGGVRSLIEPPGVSVGSPKEYATWMARLGRLWTSAGLPVTDLERIDARYNYGTNRITLYALRDPTDEWSVAETISHEFLHALLYQMGEEGAARQLDFVARAARSPDRRGGI
jgi:hypothetical protein